MAKKLRPSMKKRNQFEQALRSDTQEMVEELQRRGFEVIAQEGLEAEVDEFLGRGWYQRRRRGQAGHRNGYQTVALRTTEGIVQLAQPRIRGNAKPFVSRWREKLIGAEERLKRWAVELFVRGASVRDLEATFTDGKGQRLLTRSMISRLNERLYRAYQEFQQRDLSTLDVVFVFVDGVYESVRRYTSNQTLLCAWAICSDGTKVMLHISAAESESEQAWHGFFEEMLGRGLRQPLLVISDGARGLPVAIQRAFPKAWRQRCIAHKLRNIAVKLPRDVQKEILAKITDVYYAADEKTAHALAARFIEDYASLYPAAVDCFSDDLEACLAHLKFPLGHRRCIRTTNLLERAFLEEKRRTKIIPSHSGERSLVGLVFGALWRASQNWQRVTMSELELTQLRHIRDLIGVDKNQSQFISYRLAG